MTADTELRPDQTRQDIVTAAHHLFVSQGYHGTSMRQIARHAGVALGGIYNHFASKEALFREVLFTYHPYKTVLPVIANAEGSSLEEALANAMQVMVSELDRRPDFFNLLFIELVEFKSVHVAELFQVLYPQVLEIIQRLLRFGDHLRPIPIPIIMRAFIGQIMAYYMTGAALSLAAPDSFKENALEHFLKIYLYGIVDGKSAEA